MKKKTDPCHIIGLAMITLYLIVDRFIFDFPNYIAIPYLIVSIVILLFSLTHRKKSCASSTDEEK